MQRRHPSLIAEYQKRKSVETLGLRKRKLEQVASKSKTNDQSGNKDTHRNKQPKVSSFFNIINKTKTRKRSKLDHLTLRFIVKGMHPLSTVDQPEFRDLINGKNCSNKDYCIFLYFNTSISANRNTNNASI